MFTIEHQFDASEITLVDEGEGSLREDVLIRAGEDEIIIKQFDAMADETQIIRLSLAQVRDLAAALNLPEGAYRLPPK